MRQNNIYIKFVNGSMYKLEKDEDLLFQQYYVSIAKKLAKHSIKVINLSLCNIPNTIEERIDLDAQ